MKQAAGQLLKTGGDRILPLLTLVLWVLCTGVGIVGLCVSYPHTTLHRADDEAPPTQMIDAALPPPERAPQPLPTPPSSGNVAPSIDLPAPLPVAAGAPPATPMATPVAAPSAAIAFAVPVQGLTRIVDADQAAHFRPAQAVPTTLAARGTGAPPAPPPKAAPLPPISPPITHLTVGQGEGRQPLPQYPHEAAVAHQQGTVGVRFVVAEDGHVISAEVISPSWPLLNQEALRTIRERWMFPPGSRRIYDVPIQFQLK